MQREGTGQRGLTLMELMIVVAIIGILSAIAYPSYQDQTRKARRADARAALLGLAQAMERRATETGSYRGGAGTAGTPADTGAPRIYATQSPVDGGAALYNLTISAATAATYTVQAAPTGVQTGDRCGTLTLTHTGVRGVTGQATGVTAADCW
jgi:type IV pilus assembly protein PilE